MATVNNQKTNSNQSNSNNIQLNIITEQKARIIELEKEMGKLKAQDASKTEEINALKTIVHDMQKTLAQISVTDNIRVPKI